MRNVVTRGQILILASPVFPARIKIYPVTKDSTLHEQNHRH